MSKKKAQHAKPTKKDLKKAQEEEAKKKKAEEEAAAKKAREQEAELPEVDENWIGDLKKARDKGTAADPTRGKHERS